MRIPRSLTLGFVVLAACSPSPPAPTTRYVYRPSFEASELQGLVPASLTHREKRGLVETTAKMLEHRLDPEGTKDVVVWVDGTDIIVEVRGPLMAAGILPSVKPPAIRDTGQCGFHIRASDAYFEGASDVESELERARKWLAANPSESVDAYNALPVEAGGPWQTETRAVRAYPTRSPSGSIAERLELVTLEVNPDWRFVREDLKQVEATSGSLGFPSITFEVMDHRKADFRAFTAAHGGEDMAVVVDDVIVTMPRLHGVLPGAGVIEGGANGFSPVEVRKMLGVLRSGRLPLVLEPVVR